MLPNFEEVDGANWFGHVNQSVHLPSPNPPPKKLSFLSFLDWILCIKNTYSSIPPLPHRSPHFFLFKFGFIVKRFIYSSSPHTHPALLPFPCPPPPPPTNKNIFLFGFFVKKITYSSPPTPPPPPPPPPPKKNQIWIHGKKKSLTPASQHPHTQFFFLFYFRIGV